jgi:soluble lytic murein transglycosylase
MPAAPLLVLLVAASPPPPSHAGTERIADALAAFRQGDYAAAARALPKLGEALPKNRDYYLYFLGESHFYTGDYGKARAAFEALAKLRDSRLAADAPWRAADCLWMEDRRSQAAAAYRRLLGRKGEGDPAVARFRVAEVEADAARGKDASVRAAVSRAFMQIHVDYPAHPLGVEAGQRAVELAPPSPATKEQPEPTPQERLQRAATLSKSRHWQEALDELSRLPAALPSELATQRDFAMGMARYNGRLDYAVAAELLLSVAPRLGGERAAFAAFHGARALSRIDHDDEAIAKYHEVVARYPTSKWAGAAQFRAGWLEVNRGNFRTALLDLRETLVRFPRSGLADDAAWYLALSHHMLGETAAALSAITTYEQVARRKGENAAMRALYWRARMLMQAGQQNEARRLFRECAARSPYDYYALLSQARLRELGEPPAELARPWRGSKTPVLRDPELARVFELEGVGLDVEAGIELVRSESRIIKRHGKATALGFLLPTFHRLSAFYHAHRLAESAGQSVLGDTRLYWEAAYPRAFPGLVESNARQTGTPELFVYAIMRKESDYYPFAVSRSDARGLLQLIPSTSAEVAKKLGEPSFPDQLFDPGTNIRQGVAYLGGLLRRFRGQEALAAGAYNAGARAMMRWCDQWAGRQLDEFVELITYDQAREYIKRVLGIYARYRHLYDKPLELTMAVNTSYLKDGSVE